MFVISFSKKINKILPVVEKELKKYKFNLGKKFILFIRDALAVFYVNNDRLYGYDNDAIRYITDAPIQGIMMPIVKEELIKNNVIMDSKDIWLMTYDIVQATRKNDRGYSEPEIRKIIQEYISKNIYKNYTDYSFEEDVKKAMPILKDELRKNNLILGEEKLKRFTKKMMAIFYGKVDLCDEESIREMTVESIQSLIMSIIEDEISKNAKYYIDRRDVWLMTYDIMQTSHDNGGGYSESEIRKITQEYITKNIYENYRGYYYAEDLKKAMPIVDDELKRNNLILGEETLKQFSEQVLRSLDAKDCRVSEEQHVRSMTVVVAKFLTAPIIEDELKKNNIVMDGADIWFMAYGMMETSKKNGGGYSEPEMRKITQEYISKNLYKNYMGYSKRILPTTDQKNKWSVNEHIKKKRKNLFNSIINTVKVWYYKQGNKNR